MSHSVIAETLSPVTFHKHSAPFTSKPKIEQLPPAITKGLEAPPNFPVTNEFTPSWTSTKNESAFLSTSYATKLLCVPTKIKSELVVCGDEADAKQPETSNDYFID
jgi:hypothetical protein